jgi:hypothetical protein
MFFEEAFGLREIIAFDRALEIIENRRFIPFVATGQLAMPGRFAV